MEKQTSDSTANNYDRPYYKNYNNSYNSTYKKDNTYETQANGESDQYRGRGGYHQRGRGGDYTRGGRGRGRGSGYYQNDQPEEEKVVVVKTAPPKQNIKKKGKVEYTNEFERAFAFDTPGTESKKETKEEAEQQQNQQDKQQKEEVKEVPHVNGKVTDKASDKQAVQEVPKANGIPQKEQKEHKPKIVEKKNEDEVKKHALEQQKIIDQQQPIVNSKPSKNQIQETSKEELKVEETKEPEQATEEVKEKPPKEPVKQDFVPDENFSWDIDLESINKSKKKKKKGAISNVIPAVIKQNPNHTSLNQDIKLKIRSDLEFSMSTIDKVNKGLTNTTNCCFMNVCLQSLLSSPPFFNMLIAIGSSQEIMNELNEDGLLCRFVHLVRYFNPSDQLDKRSPFAVKVVDAEKILQDLQHKFNPFNQHQDCHEFIALTLDNLHDELALIYQPDQESKDTAWQEVGDKNSVKHFNNDQCNVQSSLVRDIFGGILRTEFHVEGRKQTTVTFEPFFVLNLEISRCEDLQSCLHSFFDAKKLNDYKVDGREVKAYHQQQIEKLPIILILQLKRFIYKDRPIKMKEDIYFPEVLEIEDQFVSTQLKMGAFQKKSDGQHNGRQYRLFSVINHKGMQVNKGHYVCYILDANDNWILYDDNKFRQVAKDTVFESQAYLLFYELIQ